jgi:hypothetical protein
MTFRYQLRHQKTPPGGINVARQPHGRGRWSNPYKIQPYGPYTRPEAIHLYREDLLAGRLRDPSTGDVLTLAMAIRELRAIRSAASAPSARTAMPTCCSNSSTVPSARRRDSVALQRTAGVHPLQSVQGPASTAGTRR